MRIAKWIAVYTALLVGANAAHADPALADLREGTMRKLQFHSEPRLVSAASFATPEGEEFTLEDWRGKYVLLNFWATWCAPCRHEMPALDALQREFRGDRFEVVTIASGRNTLSGINRFFADPAPHSDPELSAPPITDLPILLDPKANLGAEMGVFSMPVTVIIDPDGQEIARMSGGAEWYSDSARAIISTLIAPES